MLAKEQPYVRSIDIATELGFSKPSVSVAMKNLRQNGYVQMDDQGHITLTPSGRAIADTMYERHTLLSNWLIYLGVDPRTAAEDACRMEHTLSAESFGCHQAPHHPRPRTAGLGRKPMLKDLVKQCRSYRRFYQDTVIPYSELADMVDTARLAASASNAQALKFKILCTPEECAGIFRILHGRAP